MTTCNWCHLIQQGACTIAVLGVASVEMDGVPLIVDSLSVLMDSKASEVALSD